MNKIYIASTLNDAEEAVIQHEEWSLKIVIYFIGIKLKIWFLNFILSIMKFFLFKTKIPSHKNINYIVVYSVGILGDNIVRLPAIATLKKAYPKAKLTVINKYQIWSPKVPEQLFANAPYIDKVISVKHNPVQRDGFKILYDDKQTQGVKCDLFVNLSPLGERGWFGAVLREMIFAKKLHAVFASDFKVFSVLNSEVINPVLHRLANKNIPRLPEEVLKNFNLEIDYDLEIFPVNKKELQQVEEKMNLFNTGNNFVILHPGAKFQCKMWPSSRFGEISKYFHDIYDLNSIITGVNEEKNLADDILTYSGGSAISFMGETSIPETIELVRKAKLVVTNDTGLMHLATVLNIPTIAIFSTRENLKWWFPLGNKVRTVFSFTEDSLRYNNDDSMSDIMQISVKDIEQLIDKMFIEFKVG